MTLTKRKAATEGEKLHVRREGAAGRWHARTEDGELICVDQYRHDLQLFVEAAGFTWVMVGE